MLSATLTFTQTHDCDITGTTKQRQIHFIFMRDQNPPPPMTNMLNGLTTSTLSSWEIKTRHLLWPMCWFGKYINFIFMRDQNSPPPLNNTLIGIITSTLSSWGIKICHPLWPMLNGVITSTYTIQKAGHQLRANVQVAADMFVVQTSHSPSRWTKYLAEWKKNDTQRETCWQATNDFWLRRWLSYIIHVHPCTTIPALTSTKLPMPRSCSYVLGDPAGWCRSRRTSTNAVSPPCCSDFELK